MRVFGFYFANISLALFFRCIIFPRFLRASDNLNIFCTLRRSYLYFYISFTIVSGAVILLRIMSFLILSILDISFLRREMCLSGAVNPLFISAFSVLYVPHISVTDSLAIFPCFFASHEIGLSYPAGLKQPITARFWFYFICNIFASDLTSAELTVPGHAKGLSCACLIPILTPDGKFTNIWFVFRYSP